MDSDDDTPNIDELARADLVAFLRRVFSQLAVMREKEARECRDVLRELS